MVHKKLNGKSFAQREFLLFGARPGTGDIIRPAMGPKFTGRKQAQRVSAILEMFASAYPDARCALDHRDPLELLVATILSAQCTDERVNIVTRDLFQNYRFPQDYARVPLKVFEAAIRSTGFYRNKAKNIQGACRMIVEKFRSRVPDTMDDLIQLPGVARKTANVVLGVAFRKSEGIVVDTHVLRVARRLDLTAADSPGKVELDLMDLIPRERWISFSHETIFHGRRVCKARRPLCRVCPVEDVCESKDKALAFPPPAPAARKRGA
jgi:endonuclease-3